MLTYGRKSFSRFGEVPCIALKIVGGTKHHAGILQIINHLDGSIGTCLEMYSTTRDMKMFGAVGRAQ